MRETLAQLITDVIYLGRSPFLLPMAAALSWNMFVYTREVPAHEQNKPLRNFRNISSFFGIYFANYILMALLEPYSHANLPPTLRYNAVVEWIYFLVLPHLRGFAVFLIWLFMSVAVDKLTLIISAARGIPTILNENSLFIRDAEIHQSGSLFAGILVLSGIYFLRTRTWTGQLTEHIMNILLSIIILGFGVSGFYLLLFPQAVLFLLFLIVAYPLVLAFTKEPRLNKNLIELYQIGVTQIPFIGNIINQLVTGGIAPQSPNPPPLSNPNDHNSPP